MALTFPANLENAAYARTGCGRLYVANYVAAGVDGTSLTLLGMTQDGVELHFNRSQEKIECDQFLGAIGAFPVKEECTIKFKLVDTVLANVKRAWILSTAMTAGDRADSTGGTLPFGEDTSRNYKQVIYQGPGIPLVGGTTIVQLYRCVLRSASPIKFAKNEVSMVEVVLDALTDPSITVSASKGCVGQIIDG